MQSALRSRIISHLRMPLYGNAYALIFSSGATSVLGLGYWILAARLYPPAVVGLNSAVISAMLFLAGVAQLSMNNVLVRFVPQAGRYTVKLVGYSYLASLLAGGLVAIVFVLGVDIWAPAMDFIKLRPGWTVAFVVAVAASCVFSLQDSVFTGLRQTKWVPIENAAFAVAKIVLLIVFAGSLPKLGIYASWIIPVILSLLPVNLLIFVSLIPRHIVNTAAETGLVQAREVLKFASGNYLGTLFFVASNLLLPILITNQAGPTANAYFYPAWTIATGLQFISSNMAISLIVEGSIDHTRAARYSQLILLQASRLLIPAVILVMLAAPLILRAFGQEYAEHGTLTLRILALGTIPNILINLALGLARVQNRAILIMLIQGSLCGLILGLSVLWLPIFGINGVGYAWLASQTGVAIVLAYTELRSIIFAEHAPSAQTD